MHIGFIGLGIMGAPMAANLLKAGHTLVVFDVVEANVAKLTAQGAVSAISCADVARQADVIVTMLPNSPHVRQALLGPGGVAEGAREGTLILDTSSIAPLAAREISAELAARGITYLDAPVSGGEPKAIEATLAIMVGGPAGAFAHAEPLLKAMGSSVTLVGEVGSGNVAKLANQMIVAQNIAAVSEAMVLATKAGVDPERVYQAIRGGLAGSTVLEQKMGKILDGNFQPGFRIELHIKDLMNALETAAGVGVPVPQATQTLEVLKALQVAGYGREDHSALVRHFEGLAGIQVRRKA